MRRRIHLALSWFGYTAAVLSLLIALTIAAMWIRAQFAYERIGITLVTSWPNGGWRRFGILLDFGTNAIWMDDRLWVENDPRHVAELWGYNSDHFYAHRVKITPPRPITGVGVFPKRGSWFNYLGVECATDTLASHYNYPGWRMSHTPQIEMWEPEERQLGFRAPYAAWLLVLLILPSLCAHRVWRRRRRKRLGCCQKCGYDLRATPDRCPECGAIPASIQTVTAAPPPPA